LQKGLFKRSVQAKMVKLKRGRVSNGVLPCDF